MLLNVGEMLYTHYIPSTRKNDKTSELCVQIKKNPQKLEIKEALENKITCFQCLSLFVHENIH